MRAGVVVAVASRALTGGVHPVYQQNGGAGALQEVGAVLAGSLPANKVRLVLLLALALCEDHNDARELLDTSIHALDRAVTPRPDAVARRLGPAQPGRI